MQALRSSVSFLPAGDGPGVFLAAARASRPGRALSKATAGLVASGTLSSAAAMARREKDSNCVVGVLMVCTSSDLGLARLGEITR